MLEKYLDDLENRIDAEVEEDLLSQWNDFIGGRFDGSIFSPRRKTVSPAVVSWPRVFANDTLDDFELMALQQLAACSGTLADENGSIMNVRPNYGAGIVPSIFGAEIFLMEHESDTLPISRPLNGGADAVKRAIEKGIPALNSGYGGRCLAMAKYFTELFAGYPKAAKYIRIYHPDLQGPIDICDLLWGAEFFLNLVDNAELVHAFLALITETYSRYMKEWERVIPPRAGYSAHWGMMHKGRIMLRDDSAMNLSGEMFDEFIKPYDQKLLSEFGGGAIHFCGRGDHYIDRLAQMKCLYAVNMSQPECNDMETIFQHTIDKGIMLIGLSREAAETAVSRRRNLHGIVHCW